MFFRKKSWMIKTCIGKLWGFFFIYNNFSFVEGQYSDFQYKELSKEISVDLLLIAGAGSVEGYSVNCDGLFYI